MVKTLNLMRGNHLLKKELYEACQEYIAQRINTIKHSLSLIEEARNNETKSSVGDKYETGRAMMQMEEEKSKIQLSEALQVEQTLLKIDFEKKSKRVDLGSLVTTNRGTYFLAIGIGKLKCNEKVYYCVSIDAPIARELKNKSVGEEVLFNGNKIQIIAVD